MKVVAQARHRRQRWGYVGSHHQMSVCSLGSVYSYRCEDGRHVVVGQSDAVRHHRGGAGGWPAVHCLCGAEQHRRGSTGTFPKPVQYATEWYARSAILFMMSHLAGPHNHGRSRRRRRQYYPFKSCADREWLAPDTDRRAGLRARWTYPYAS